MLQIKDYNDIDIFSHMEYKECRLCPKNCGVNRHFYSNGNCGMPSNLVVSRAALHHWEEPCLSGTDENRGAGTVFFSGCSLNCVYCQNRPISNDFTDSFGKASIKPEFTYNKVVGKEINTSRLTEIFLDLEAKGAYNIDLVTPTHFSPHIKNAVLIARQKGLSIPIVYNTSGYEKAEVLNNLENTINIYLTDFKYFSDKLSVKYSNAPNYFSYASEALAEMVRQKGTAEFDENGIMQKGIIVRHLVLPGHVDDSKRIIKYLHETYGDKIYISIMNQFTPMNTSTSAAKFPELHRNLTKEEYDEVVNYAIDIGVENGFIQEGETADESFIPLFECEGI